MGRQERGRGQRRDTTVNRKERQGERERERRKKRLEEMPKLCALTGKPYSRGRLSTFDLLVQTGLNQRLFKIEYINLCYKTGYLNEKVNCTDPFSSVTVLWLINLQI